MGNTFKVTLYLDLPVCSPFHVSVYTVDSKALVTKKKKNDNVVFTEALGALLCSCACGNPGEMVAISEAVSCYHIVFRPFCWGECLQIEEHIGS